MGRSCRCKKHSVCLNAEGKLKNSCDPNGGGISTLVMAHMPASQLRKMSVQNTAAAFSYM